MPSSISATCCRYENSTETNYEKIDFDSMDLEWNHGRNTSKEPRAVHMASECRRRLTEATKEIIDQIKNKSTNDGRSYSLGLILSGGVDTCAILEASSKLRVVFDVAITCVIGETSPDELYAKYAAYKHRDTVKKHVIVRMTPEELVEKYLPRTIQTLQVWDGMTIRNSLVISAAFEEARNQSLTDVLVGDGADELFGGYTFTWGKPDEPDQWKEKRDNMCRSWTFATDDLATSYGLKSHSPYMDPTRMVDWAVKETHRQDCIADDRCYIQPRLGEPYVKHTTGKVLLREAFQTGSSWRRKDPIEVGSGATVIGYDDYWTTEPHNITDEEFKKEQSKLKEEHAVTIHSKENLVNIRIYQKLFCGIKHPTKKRLPRGHGCVGCCFEIGDSMFCHICGAWPAQRWKVEEMSKVKKIVKKEEHKSEEEN